MTATHELVVPKSMPIMSLPADFELQDATTNNFKLEDKYKAQTYIVKNNYIPEWPCQTHPPTG